MPPYRTITSNEEPFFGALFDLKKWGSQAGTDSHSIRNYLSSRGVLSSFFGKKNLTDTQGEKIVGRNII